MKRKLLFFINPVSGIRSKESLDEKIGKKCRAEGIDFNILETSKDRNYHFLPEKIEKEKITDVVVCGGDGSISPVVSVLLHSVVNVGIIPLGSGNGLARTAGIPYSVAKALDVIFTGTPQYVDAFRINNHLGCQIAGLGFDALVASAFARERSRGLSTYTKLAIKNFFRATAYPFSIACETGEHFDVNAFILCVSNANQFGNNIRIAPRASLNDGLLDVIILKKTHKMRILVAFVNHLLFAKKTEDFALNFRNEKILYFNCKKLSIENKALAPVHIDGDPLTPAEKFEIEIIPSAYKLIRPV